MNGLYLSFRTPVSNSRLSSSSADATIVTLNFFHPRRPLLPIRLVSLGGMMLKGQGGSSKDGKEVDGSIL